MYTQCPECLTVFKLSGAELAATLGSGDPTRAICSSLIAAAFGSVRYPVLPDVEIARAKGEHGHHHG